MPARKYRSGTIRMINNARGKTFEAYISVDKKPIKKRFKTEGQARAFIDFHEPLIRSQLESLDSEAMMDAARARKILPAEYTLTEVVNSFLKSEQNLTKIGVSEAIDQFLEQKQKAGRSTATISSYRNNLSKLRPLQKNISEVTFEDLDRIIDLPGHSAISINNLIRDFRVFWNWAKKRGFATESPADQLERLTTIKTLASTFINEQCAALLYAAKQCYPEVLAEFAIGLFAGVRPAECQRLQWKHVRKNIIHITADTSKSVSRQFIRQQRYIDIAPNLNSWLKNIRGDANNRIARGGKSDRKKKKMLVRKLAGIKEWPDDVLRHTFATNHLMHYQSSDKTSMQLGHITNRDLLFDHYRNLITKQEADAFWAMTPENVFEYFSSKQKNEIENAAKIIKEYS